MHWTIDRRSATVPVQAELDTFSGNYLVSILRRVKKCPIHECASGLAYYLLFDKGKTNPNLSAETNRFGLCVLGSPGWTRTSDTLINSQVLLPTELRRNIKFSCEFYSSVFRFFRTSLRRTRDTLINSQVLLPTELRRNIYRNKSAQPYLPGASPLKYFRRM